MIELTNLQGGKIYVRAAAINIVRTPLPGEYGGSQATAIVVGATTLAVQEGIPQIVALMGSAWHLPS